MDNLFTAIYSNNYNLRKIQYGYKEIIMLDDTKSNWKLTDKLIENLIEWDGLYIIKCTGSSVFNHTYIVIDNCGLDYFMEEFIDLKFAMKWLLQIESPENLINGMV